MLKIVHPDSDGKTFYSIKFEEHAERHRDLFLQFMVETSIQAEDTPKDVGFSLHFLMFIWESLTDRPPPLLADNDSGLNVTFNRHKNRFIWWAWTKIREEIDDTGTISGNTLEVNIGTDQSPDAPSYEREWARGNDFEICKDQTDDSGTCPEDIVNAFIKGDEVRYFPPKPRIGF